ncbi:hypothetical protein OG285_36695 (plasmid) [Streptomyces sp. NBC_01471]|uniref:hypothetical protein n=1 Tax=Streptomyces sp. NBC_01471 TaxID=2903879 RepID=UPI002F91B6A9
MLMPSAFQSTLKPESVMAPAIALPSMSSPSWTAAAAAAEAAAKLMDPAMLPILDRTLAIEVISQSTSSPTNLITLARSAPIPGRTSEKIELKISARNAVSICFSICFSADTNWSA